MADTLTDSTVVVRAGFTGIIYVDNQVYVSDTIVLKWRIDSVVHNLGATLQDGICTYVCYPSSKREGLEEVSPLSALPLKAYFIDPSGITDTGTARMYVTVFDTADSLNTLTRLTYILHILIDTTADTPTAVLTKGQHAVLLCVRLMHTLEGPVIVNVCDVPVQVAVMNIWGQVIGTYRAVPGEQIVLPSISFVRLFVVSNRHAGAHR